VPPDRVTRRPEIGLLDRLSGLMLLVAWRRAGIRPIFGLTAARPSRCEHSPEPHRSHIQPRQTARNAHVSSSLHSTTLPLLSPSIMAASIPLLCFNDVYRVNQKYVPQPGAPRAPGQADKSGSSGEISVSQFAQLVYDIRDGWDKVEGSGGDEPEREGLVLFAGDVFNPSVESSVTRGSHMVSSISSTGCRPDDRCRS